MPRIPEDKRSRASLHDFVLVKVKKNLLRKYKVHAQVRSSPPFWIFHVSKSHTGKKVDSGILISDSFSNCPT